MKLHNIPENIEEFLHTTQLEVQKEFLEMSKQISMSRKEFQFLADVVKKWYASAVTEEVPGVIWAEQLLVEELKSRCKNFNQSIWDVYVGYEWVKNVNFVPEQQSHLELDHEDQ